MSTPAEDDARSPGAAQPVPTDGPGPRRQRQATRPGSASGARRGVRSGVGLKRILIAVAVALVVLVVGAAVTAVALVRRPYPQVEGSVQLPGLAAKVDVVRDAHGIPQVYADSSADLFRAQGYVQAQDRFFEMDWRRHVTAGRISELAGKDADALAADKVVRTLGWRRVAQLEYDRADATTKAYLDAYAAGVNAYLADRSPGDLGLDYRILALDHPLAAIEPWSPVDSLAWFKAMAWELRGNYDDELARARVFANTRDLARVEQLYPPYPYDRHAPILPSLGSQGALVVSALLAPAPRSSRPVDTGFAEELGGAGAQDALAGAQRSVLAIPHLLGGQDGVGSNSWVISGALTATGKPLLDNDPHLAPSIPGIWYQMGLHCRTVSAGCPFDVSGYTFSGVPGVIIGHTNRISWGLTNLGPDVTDFYLERVTGDGYEVDGKTKPLATRQETIAVAGADPVTITVRSTGHGPLLSDVVASLASAGSRAPVGKAGPVTARGYAVSLAWTALQPGADIQAIFGIDAATDFASFRKAVLLMDVPAQNFVYADVDGHIGYQAPGRIPIRKGATAFVAPSADQGAGAGTSSVTSAGPTVPTDGTWPLPGWESRYDWDGYYPTDSLPYVEDPAEGFIVAANQAVTGPNGPIVFGRDPDYGYRSQRIRDTITAAVLAHKRLSVQDMAAIQADTHNGIAHDLLPLLTSASVDSFTADGVALLKSWDGTQPADSAAAAYFNAVWERLLDLTFADEMPIGTRPDGGGRWDEVIHVLLANPQDQWWDDRRTANVVETRDEVIRQSLVQARLRLTQLLGKDPSGWTWGKLHQLNLERTPLGTVGSTQPIHGLLNRVGLRLAGGPAIVDATGWDASAGTFAVDWAPSMRMVVNLADLDASTWVNQTGASGHPGNENYADQLQAWATGETFPWPFTKQAVDRAATHHLTLTPAT